MGAFFLFRCESTAENAQFAEIGDASMRQQGFVNPQKLSNPAFELRTYSKLSGIHQGISRGVPGEFAFCTGTFIYNDHVGEAALAEFLRDFDGKSIDWDRIWGHFCVGIYKYDRLKLFTDRMGIYKLYCDPGHRIFSSSFLTVTAMSPRRTVNTQGLYEYVFTGATYGSDTVLQDVRIAAAGKFLELGRVSPPTPLDEEVCFPDRASSESQLVENNLSNLRRYVKLWARLFPRGMSLGLSGGYDSRLLLAMAQAHGITPFLYSFGSKKSSDVRVATLIAEEEGLCLQPMDRAELRTLTLNEFAEVVNANYHFFDGYPIAGLFDNGMDVQSRRWRCGGFRAMLNGGGGEVFRIFYPIASVRLTPDGFVRRCFNDFPIRGQTSRFQSSDYLSAIAGKVVTTVPLVQGRLTRTALEVLYSTFRCGYWLGRNESINNRLSWSLAPFTEYGIARDAWKIPLKFKLHGIFEAKLIAALSPKLASYPTGYGSSFVSSPGWKRVFSDRLTIFRKTCVPWNPSRFRRSTKRITPQYIRPEYLSQVIDIKYPYLSQWFDIGSVYDPEILARVATLEFLFSKLRPQVPSA